MKLLNWREVSRTLTGGDEGVRANSVPNKHKEAVRELTDYCELWVKKYGINS